jgi:hypothetical protein
MRIQILSGVDFFTEMIGLLKPLIENQADDSSYVAFRGDKIHR